MVDFNPNGGNAPFYQPYKPKAIMVPMKEHNPNYGRNKIYGEAYTMIKPLELDEYHSGALSHIEEMLDVLEDQKYINSNKFIYQEYGKDENIPKRFTTKEILLELLDQTLMNSIESMSKKWKASNCVGSSVSVIAFTEQDKLWVRIIDNGGGFPEDLLSKIGNESLSNRDERSSDKYHFNEALKDHLFKTGQLVQTLGWKLIAENNKHTGGASISLVLPLLKPCL